MRGTRVFRVGALAFSAALGAATVVMSVGAAQAATPSSTAHSTVYVSPHAAKTHSGTSCATAKYATIQGGVNAASAGGTVVVCSGIYHQDVVVAKSLTLRGQSSPLIMATRTTSHMCQFIVMGPPVTAPCLAGITITASHVRVSGFTIRDSQGEGILATGSLAHGSISGIWITDNVVTDNDEGGPTSAYPQCQGQEPDCGEGIHLMGVTHSVVSGNKVTANSGGVLVTDEMGPTHDNLIMNNLVANNTRDCGITLPGHNPFAYDPKTKTLKPDVAGVFDNTIKGNIVTGNGTKGFGAGVLFAVPIPGSASYGNLVEGNYIAGNGLAGVTLHDHLPGGAYMKGNVITGNAIGRNNVLGDQFDTNPPAPLTVTTGITVYSGADPVTITISRNLISNDKDGIWRTTNVHITGLNTNAFVHVTHPLVSVPPM